MRIFRKLLRFAGLRGVQHVLSLFNIVIAELHELAKEKDVEAHDLRKEIMRLETERAVALSDVRKARVVADKIGHLLEAE